MSSAGMVGTFNASRLATAATKTTTAALLNWSLGLRPAVHHINRPVTAETRIKPCCACWLPIQETGAKVVTRIPATAPPAVDAYISPTTHAASGLSRETAASANGKVTPHRHVAGRSAKNKRNTSNWKLIQGSRVREGLIGQYGRERASTYAVQAIAAQKRTWHRPKTHCGRFSQRAMTAPALLPIPIPSKKTASMSEKVYTVPPKRSDRWRVQITPATNAVIPVRAVDTCIEMNLRTGTAPSVAGG